ARLPAPGGGLSRPRHQRRLVRPDGGPLSALESPGDAGHRGACGDRPCRELRHLGHGGSAGPRARCDRARSPHGRSEYAHHERCDDAVRAARGLGGDAGGDRDARVRRRAGSATMEIGARWGGGAVRLGVDIGGTFTDLVAVAADGAIAVRKVATTPEDPAVGMFRAIEPLPGPVELLVHGTTIATKARLEREARSRIGTRRIMTSTGGTLAPPAAACRAAALALSGPAGGVVGAQLVGAAVGLSELLTLDMGGTSADASLVTGGTAVHEGGGAVAGIPLALPSILIETVSAGGGSIARLDEDGAPKVRPQSAAAIPGPTW